MSRKRSVYPNCCDARDLCHIRKIYDGAKHSVWLQRCAGCGAGWLLETEDIWYGGMDDDDVEFTTLAPMTERKRSRWKNRAP